jgi:hypothetical protein
MWDSLTQAWIAFNAHDNNKSPAKPPTAIPIIVVTGNLFDDEGGEAVEDDVGPEPTPVVLDNAPPSPVVAVAGIAAGAVAGRYPFSLQYCA